VVWSRTRPAAAAAADFCGGLLNRLEGSRWGTAVEAVLHLSVLGARTVRDGEMVHHQALAKVLLAEDQEILQDGVEVTTVRSRSHVLDVHVHLRPVLGLLVETAMFGANAVVEVHKGVKGGKGRKLVRQAVLEVPIRRCDAGAVAPDPVLLLALVGGEECVPRLLAGLVRLGR
jgi:hypothetical protein